MMSSEAYRYILWTVFWVVLGFTISPWFLLIAGFTAFTAYSELTHKPESVPEAKTWRNATEVDDWISLYHAGCESPAETAFLDALIAEYDLKPDNGVLKSPDLVIEIQFECMRYRFDFLANGSHIIEIDGAAWHSSPEQVERDRLRDEASRSAGFEVLRIPAKVVFNTPKEAIRRVREALNLSDFPVQQRGKVVEIEKPKSFLQHTNAMFKGITEGLDEINRYVDQAARKRQALSEFESAIALESKLLDMAEESANMYVERARRLKKLPLSVRESIRVQTDIDIKKLRAMFDDNPTPNVNWPELPDPGFDSDPKIQEQITHTVHHLKETRDKRFAELKAKSEKDIDFQKGLFDAIYSYNCSANVKSKLFNVFTWVKLAQDRRKETAVSTLEGHQQIEEAKQDTSPKPTT